MYKKFTKIFHFAHKIRLIQIERSFAHMPRYNFRSETPTFMATFVKSYLVLPFDGDLIGLNALNKDGFLNFAAKYIHSARLAHELR